MVFTCVNVQTTYNLPLLVKSSSTQTSKIVSTVAIAPYIPTPALRL